MKGERLKIKTLVENQKGNRYWCYIVNEDYDGEFYHIYAKDTTGKYLNDIVNKIKFKKEVIK